MIDFLSIEFKYHKVDTYQLDLVCFKDLEGTITKDIARKNFEEKKTELLG